MALDKQTRRAALLGASALMAAGASARAADKPEAAILAAVQASIDASDTTGAAVAVRRNGKLTLLASRGAADDQKSVPLQTDTVIWCASMSKSVVSTSVMQMVDGGKVKLDDPAGKFIPEFAAKPRMVRTPKPGFNWPAPGAAGGPRTPVEYDLRPAKRDITVRDILTMTSGLQTIGVPNVAIPAVGPTETVAEWTPKLADVPLDFEPGSHFGYSNATAFEVAVRIVEVASGQAYGVYMREHVFSPLGMKDSSFGPREDLKRRTQPVAQINQINNSHFTSGSAGLFCTAEDYSRYGQMLLDGGTFEGRRVLSAASAAAIVTPQSDVSFPGIDEQGYGGITDRETPGIRMGLGGLVITDAAAARLTVPTGSYSWDGVGQRRFWVIPARKMVLVMMIPAQLKPGGAWRLQRAIERAALS